MATRMLQRRGTTAEWAAINPVLGDGELGYDKTTGVIKVGDGTSTWSALTTIYRRFVDAVAKVGDTMTGPLILKNGANGARIDNFQDGALRVVNEAGNAYIDLYADEIRGQSVFDSGARVYSSVNPQPIANAFAIVDAKGDIMVGTADNTVTRVPVGSNDQVLVADSTQASGVRWATPASAGVGFAELFLHGGS